MASPVNVNLHVSKNVFDGDVDIMKNNTFMIFPPSADRPFYTFRNFHRGVKDVGPAYRSQVVGLIVAVKRDLLAEKSVLDSLSTSAGFDKMNSLLKTVQNAIESAVVKGEGGGDAPKAAAEIKGAVTKIKAFADTHDKTLKLGQNIRKRMASAAKLDWDKQKKTEVERLFNNIRKRMRESPGRTVTMSVFLNDSPTKPKENTSTHRLKICVNECLDRVLWDLYRFNKASLTDNIFFYRTLCPREYPFLAASYWKPIKNIYSDQDSQPYPIYTLSDQSRVKIRTKKETFRAIYTIPHDSSSRLTVALKRGDGDLIDAQSVDHSDDEFRSNLFGEARSWQDLIEWAENKPEPGQVEIDWKPSSFAPATNKGLSESPAPPTSPVEDTKPTTVGDMTKNAKENDRPELNGSTDRASSAPLPFINAARQSFSQSSDPTFGKATVDILAQESQHDTQKLGKLTSADGNPGPNPQQRRRPIGPRQDVAIHRQPIRSAPATNDATNEGLSESLAPQTPQRLADIDEDTPSEVSKTAPMSLLRYSKPTTDNRTTKNVNRLNGSNDHASSAPLPFMNAARPSFSQSSDPTFGKATVDILAQESQHDTQKLGKLTSADGNPGPNPQQRRRPIGPRQDVAIHRQPIRSAPANNDATIKGLSKSPEPSTSWRLAGVDNLTAPEVPPKTTTKYPTPTTGDHMPRNVNQPNGSTDRASSESVASVNETSQTFWQNLTSWEAMFDNLMQESQNDTQEFGKLTSADCNLEPGQDVTTHWQPIRSAPATSDANNEGPSKLLAPPTSQRLADVDDFTPPEIPPKTTPMSLLKYPKPTTDDRVTKNVNEPNGSTDRASSESVASLNEKSQTFWQNSSWEAILDQWHLVQESQESGQLTKAQRGRLRMIIEKILERINKLKNTRRHHA